jgi:Peptidase family M28
MKKNYTATLSILFICGILYWVFSTMMSQTIIGNENLSEFSTKRALKIVKTISQKPHFVGSQNHEAIGNYLVSELEKMGLETSYQEGFSLSDWGNLTKPKNILARIKGTNSSKALLLLSHYDSAPHSYSHGASDDGSGVATILEGIRAFLKSKATHKNDIIILFSDAEELGLNGAALFATQHKWAKDIGLALNFEARGTSGPSYMLMEVNQGNGLLVNGFTNANPQFPVSNSLMYSIYKMLPNDTDLTVFREQSHIQGFNFAFIDDHFNYHTAQDDLDHLNHNTLAHQGTYLMPLLKYFANANLKNMNSNDDFVYFNTPLGFINYPFEWVLPIWIGALVLFLLIVFIGIGKRTLLISEIGKGFIPLLLSLVITGSVTFFGWKALLQIYPQYNDILHGFTYNGHDYIAAFVLLSLCICFLIYQKFDSQKVVMGQFVAPLLFWILINFAIALRLQGAGFLIFPVISGILMLAYFVITQKQNWFVNLIFCIPTLVIIAPFIQMFPIGLGLKIMFGSAILVALCYGLLLPVFGSFNRKKTWSLLFFIASIGFFANAHFNSNYQKGKAKPNSLLYILDADSNKAVWATYDKNLDDWTKNYLTEKPNNAENLKNYPLFSKYNSDFTFTKEAPKKAVSAPIIQFLRDSIAGNNRFLKIKILPTRKVNRYDVFANEDLIFQNFKANKVKTLGQKGTIYNRKGKKILSYYVVDNIPLEMEFSIEASKILDMDLMESSFDLMNNPMFTIATRKSWMMPMPFVLTDAVIVKQKIKPTERLQIPVCSLPPKKTTFTVSKKSLR